MWHHHSADTGDAEGEGDSLEPLLVPVRMATPAASHVSDEGSSSQASSRKRDAQAAGLGFDHGRRFIVTFGGMCEAVDMTGTVHQEDVLAAFAARASACFNAVCQRHDVTMYHEGTPLTAEQWAELMGSSCNTINITVKTDGRSFSDWDKEKAWETAKTLLGSSKWVCEVHPDGSPYARISLPIRPIADSATVTLGPLPDSSCFIQSDYPPELTVGRGEPAALEWLPNGYQVTFGDQVNRIVDNLILAATTYGNFLPQSVHAHRSMVEPIFLLAFAMARELHMGCSSAAYRHMWYCPDRLLRGNLAWGKASAVIIYKGLPAVAMQVQGGDNLKTAWPQVYATAAAMRDMIVQQVLGAPDDLKLKKRKHFEVELLQELPTHVVLCKADEYCIFRYKPSEVKPRLSHSTCSLSLHLRWYKQRSRPFLHQLVTELLRHLISTFIMQCKAIDELLEPVLKERNVTSLPAQLVTGEDMEVLARTSAS